MIAAVEDAILASLAEVADRFERSGNVEDRRSGERMRVEVERRVGEADRRRRPR